MMTTQKESHQSGPGLVASNIENLAIIADPDRDTQRLVLLNARAALSGCHLQRQGNGLLLSRWVTVCFCADLEHAERHLQRIGA